ncbi:hypothetical protein ACFU96_10275 [Streptomyces sp. NPDC057620]|uniref:hypothetical protein n=1 Tax=Streptomyces sp. NPDC057620 TaxID=3346185 RepID=UPI003692F585
MSRKWKITVVVAGVAGTVSTPLIWLLNNPGTGQLVGASIQAATSIAALVWALLQRGGDGTGGAIVRSGQAHASGGGTAVSGMKRPRGQGSGSVTTERTGDATVAGGDITNSGIHYGDSHSPPGPPMDDDDEWDE